MARRRRSEVSEDETERRSRETKPANRGTPGGRRETTTVPHDSINEIVMIAAVVVDAEAAATYLPRISADSFFGAGHAEAWSVLQQIHKKGLHYDPATVQQLSGGAVDPEMLEAYAAERPKVPPNIRHHAQCIEWDRARVQAVRGPVSAFLEAIKDPTTDPSRVRALARAIGQSFDGVGDRRFLRDTQQMVREHRKELEDRRHGRAHYPYGLDGMDYYAEGEPEEYEARLVPGMAPGQLTVVAGISGCGKSTTTARIALQQSKFGKRVLWGAWEQDAKMSLELIATFALDLDRTDMMTGKFDEETQEDILAEMEKLGQNIKFLDLPFGRGAGEGKRSNAANLDMLQQYICDVCPDVFIADLFRRALAQTDPDEEEHALYRIQAMAQETQTHGILVHQLRLKDVEARPDQRPTRESIKGSSAWIDVADTIIGWYRPSLHRNVPDDKIQAIILKQRYGKWPLAVEFDWDPCKGNLWGGRSIEYERPGQEGEMDNFLGESFLAKSKATRGKARR